MGLWGWWPTNPDHPPMVGDRRQIHFILLMMMSNTTSTIKPCRTKLTINHFKAHPNQIIWYRTDKVWVPGLVTNVDRFHIEVKLPGNKLQPLSLTSKDPGMLELELWEDNRDKRIMILKTGVNSKDKDIRNKCSMSMTFIRNHIIPAGQSSLTIGLSVNIASNHNLRNLAKPRVPNESRSSFIRQQSPPTILIDNSGYDLSKPRLKRPLKLNEPEPSYEISKPKHRIKNARLVGLENGIAKPRTVSHPKSRVPPSTAIQSDLDDDKECVPAYDVSRPVLKRIGKGKGDCPSKTPRNHKPPKKLERQLSTGIETVQYLEPLVCNDDGNGSLPARIIYSSDEDNQCGHAEQVDRSHVDQVPIGQEVLASRTSGCSSNSLDEDSDTEKDPVIIYAPARILAHTTIPNHFRVRFYDGTEHDCVSRNSILVLGDHAFGSVVVERIPDPPKVCLSNYQNPILEMRLRLVVPLLDEIVGGTRVCARAQQYRSHSTKRRMDLNVNCGGDPYSPNEMAFIRHCLQVRYLRVDPLIPSLDTGFLSTKDLPVVDQQFLDLVLIPECVVRLLILTHLLDRCSHDMHFDNSATAPIPHWRWTVMSEYTLYSSQYNDPTTPMQTISEADMRLNYLMSMDDEPMYLQMAEQLLRDSHWVFGLLELQRVY